MAADDVVVEPGDMLLLHTGFATQVLEWGGNPDASRIQAMHSHLDGNDEDLLQWIADSQISALIADNYAVEGWATHKREPHTPAARSTTCACSSSASRWASSGTSTTSPRGCGSTGAAASCSPRRRCGCPAPRAPR